MKKIVIIIVATLLFSLPIFSQIKYKNDNYKLLNEFGFHVGIAIFEEDQCTYYNLDAANFFSPNVGVRSGVTYYAKTMNAGWMVKIPVYVAFRTANKKNEYDVMAPENIDNNLLQDIIYSIIGELPMKFEFNIGPSIGYVSPESGPKKLSSEEKRKLDDYFVHAKMSISADANLRISYYINRVGINLTLGGGYWVTNNFKYYSVKGDEDNGKVSRWMGNFSAGLTYRF